MFFKKKEEKGVLYARRMSPTVSSPSLDWDFAIGGAWYPIDCFLDGKSTISSTRGTVFVRCTHAVRDRMIFAHLLDRGDSESARDTQTRLPSHRLELFCLLVEEFPVKLVV
jgi:hypothetical protein